MSDLVLFLEMAGRLCLGLIFVVSGASKLARQSSIRHVIAAYRLLPQGAVAPAAVTLAIVETGIGSALALSFLPLFAMPATLGAAMLLCLFSVAIASTLFRGIVVPCGCSLIFNGHVVTWATFARNQLLLALLLVDHLLQSGMVS